MGYQVERVSYARKVGLRGKRKQTPTAAPEAAQLLDRIDQPKLAIERQVTHAGAATPREFAKSIHRVVVVDRQRELAAATERVTLAYELDRTAGIHGEHHVVHGVVCIEELEHTRARSLQEGGAASGGVALRVWVPKHPFDEKISMRVQLRFCVERAARVVEVREPQAIEPRILTDSKRFEEGLARLLWRSRQ